MIAIVVAVVVVVFFIDAGEFKMIYYIVIFVIHLNLIFCPF